MLTTNNETFILKKWKRIENSPYEWEDVIELTFKGRPANAREKKMYRITQGVNGNDESIFIFASNLPKDIKPGDKIEFQGDIKVVMSTGYYYDNTRIINNSIFSNDYIEKRCPKGINLQ